MLLADEGKDMEKIDFWSTQQFNLRLSLKTKYHLIFYQSIQSNIGNN